MKRTGFTLVELLVVIAVTVVLLALLSPALDRAVTAANVLECLARERLMIDAAVFYATDQKKYFPPNAIAGRGSGSAYDLRMWIDDNGVPTPYFSNPGGAGAAGGFRPPPLQLGLLPENRYLPPDRLGKIMHCPIMDNLGNPTSFGGGLRFAGIGMDVIHEWGVGASWFNDPAEDKQSLRVIMGYNYRATSYEWSGKGKLRLNNTGSNDLMIVDLPDQRFVGVNNGRREDLRAFTHPDGYNRVFADTSGGWHNDSEYNTARAIQTWTGGNMDGLGAPAVLHERVYTQYIRFDRSPDF